MIHHASFYKKFWCFIFTLANAELLITSYVILDFNTMKLIYEMTIYFIYFIYVILSR